jgi:hypothetical protein
MGKEYKIEELLENLPDYINGKMEDEELKKAISSEISGNPGFKNEFDSLKSAFKSLNSFKFSEPPDYYFNNLLPRINGKINVESQSFIFKKSFTAIWKFALPVTAVILMFIGYKTFFSNNDIMNNVKNDSQIVLNNDFQNKIKNDDSINKIEEDLSSSKTENKDEDVFSNMTKSYFSRQNVHGNNNLTNAEENNNPAIDISENTPDDDVFFSNDDEPNIEQEFDKLNSDEQNKILSEIKNSKF